MQYVIMFAMVVMASIVDIVTGIIKAHITNSYDSTIMKNGLYSKALNWLVMMFSIGCEVGMSMLGKYYQCETIAGFAGAIAAGTVFGLIMLMEALSIFENFAIANPKSGLSKVIGKRLRKVAEQLEKEENIEKPE
jgi:phage-related holin